MTSPQPYLEVIAAFPGPDPDNMPTYVLRDLQPAALQALGADLVTAETRGESLQDVLAVWAVVQ